MRRILLIITTLTLLTSCNTIQNAITDNNVQVVENYIYDGNNLNEIDKDGQTILITATKSGKKEIVELLLKN